MGVAVLDCQSLFKAEISQQSFRKDKGMLQTVDHIGKLESEQFRPSMHSVEVAGHIGSPDGQIPVRLQDALQLLYVASGIQNELDHVGDMDQIKSL